MELTIRSYEMKDAVVVAGLITEEMGYTDSVQQQVIARLRRFQVHPDYYTLVALDQREVIGFVGLHKAMAYEFDEEYIKITALAVKGCYQNEEVGAKLLEGVEAYAKKRGIQRIVINSPLESEETHAFYERRGYEEKGYTFTKMI